jgi:NAD(P)-dependent dehydrogenase (short-subunit alcohol dehydrogenase family)
MRILIAGASGAIGRPLVRRLRANQHEVFALTRSPDSAPALKEIGAEPVIADALDAAAVKAAVGRIRPDAVINELTSLPRHYTPAEMKAAAERDRKVRVEGNINLLAALRDSGARRYLLQSSAFWYAPGGWRTSLSRSSPARPRESRPAPAPTWNWKRAHRRPRESSSSRYVTDSSTAPAPGTRARAILVIRCGNSRFQLSVRARASTASCILTMRLRRPLPRSSARRERTTSSTETRRLSTCG